MIKVSSFLKSDKVAIQLHGIQKMNEALAAMRLDEEHYIFLGPATFAFIHQPEPVRTRAAKILENYFPSIWDDEGLSSIKPWIGWKKTRDRYTAKKMKKRHICNGDTGMDSIC